MQALALVLVGFLAADVHLVNIDKAAQHRGVVSAGSIQLSRLAPDSRRSNRRSHRRNSRGIRPRPSQGPDHHPADRGA